MKYKRCCACDYYVTAADARCPNCGIADPRSDRKPPADTLTLEAPMTDGTRAAFGGFIGAVIGGFLMDGMGVAVGVAVGVSLGVLLGADRDWSTPEPSPLLKRSIDSLKQIEENIQQRLADITNRESRLAEARQQVTEQERRLAQEAGSGSLSPWEKVRTHIDSGAAALARQRDRYHAKLWEITLIRWQNRLDPVAADWETLTHEECASRLKRLDEVQQEGKQYLKEWEGVDLTELPEAQRCLDRLRAALTACDQVREQLIVQQATLALKGIAPADEVLSDHVTQPSLQNLDAFNARAALGEFSTAFDELEAEYARLRSDEELAEKAAFVNRLGR